jgi:diacylglycerol kinase family enzyme
MSVYSAIVIIFNPKSTGDSKANAEALRKQLQQRLPDVPITLLPTTHAGHAKELAYQQAKASSRPLIISSSGDGGYHEVINGVMQAQEEGATALTGLLPSGNANDHYRSLTSGEVQDRIVSNRQRRIDLLHITATRDNETWQRYAHSYAGVGLTAEVGIKLNQIDLNPINEWVVATRIIYNTPPSKLVINGESRTYDSLIFSNVSRLAKVFTLDSTSQIDDGKFEVIALQSKNKVEMLREIARALTGKVRGVSQVATFSFETTARQAMQLDGEIVTLEPGTRVKIASRKQVLSCVI